MKISEHFTKKELGCHGSKCCDNSCCMDDNFMDKLEILRKETGPLHVTNGYRCMVHNREVGGVDSSWHTHGKAVDVYSNSLGLQEIYDLAIKHFEEVIVYTDKRFIHIANPLT